MWLSLMLVVLLTLLVGWSLLALILWTWQRPLFIATWREPYFVETPVLIESDDWGPGPAWHAERLRALCIVLASHHDRLGRAAVLTADMVLSVPDADALKHPENPRYLRRFLDTDFPQLHLAFVEAQQAGLLVPQLHGVEHCYAEGLLALAEAGDPRLEVLDNHPERLDWERLDSPLQAHHVDATRLPSRPLPIATQQAQVTAAMEAFIRLFGFPSRTAVAPCYLWDDNTEAAWAGVGVRHVQTAGYRCTGRDDTGRYIQNPPLLRLGHQGPAGLGYLVRNCMYEPVDGRGVEGCLDDLTRALAEAAPVVISTHRYNYTRSEAEHRDSLAGLDRLLDTLRTRTAGLRFLSSPELGDALSDPDARLKASPEAQSWPALPRLTGLARCGACLMRLRHRHAKLDRLLRLSLLGLALTPLVWLGQQQRRRAAAHLTATGEPERAG